MVCVSNKNKNIQLNDFKKRLPQGTEYRGWNQTGTQGN